MDLAIYISVRVVGLLDILSGEVSDDSAGLRLLLYSFLWRIFMENPIVGMGPGGAGRIAEGQLIRELVEGGIVGGLLFLGLVFRCGQLAARSHRDSEIPIVQGVSVGFVCGLFGLVGQSFFTDLLILTKIGVPFWILAAIVHRAYGLEQRSLRSI